MAGRGRRTKLNPAVQHRIVQAIGAGNYHDAAAAYGGVSYATFRLWMIKGERSRSGIYFDFFEAVQRAEAEAEIRMVAQWQMAIPDDWKAARDFLARRYPARWGPKVEISVASVARAMAEAEGLSADETEAAIAEAERLAVGKAVGTDPYH